MATTVDGDIARSFASAFAGTTIAQDDPEYDAARAVWNGSIDARPLLVAQCRTTDDIVTAVELTSAWAFLLPSVPADTASRA